MSNDPLPTIHGYRLVRPLGKGSYGSVWEALGAGGFRAALKFISLAHSGTLAEPELKALEESKELNHPHLVQTREVFIDDEWVIIVMEHAAGSLRERFQFCRQNGMPGVPVDELLHYTRQAADALDYLHGLNKLHRDIKPDNLLITSTDSPHIKVGDIGLLRDRDRMTTMAVQGSPPYIAPEAWVRQTVPASDQFSLAATYVEMRLGRLPFEGANAGELSMNIQFLEPTLEGLEPAEQEVLKVGLAKTPEGRFLTCRDFVNALEASLSVSATTYRPKGKIGLLKKAVTLAPPRVKGESLKPASQPDIGLSTAPPTPGPPVTFPPGSAQASNVPPTFPPPTSATARGAADGTMKAVRPGPTTTPPPPAYGPGTLMPGSSQGMPELVPVEEQAPAPVRPLGRTTQPPIPPPEEPAPPARPQRPPGLGFGAVLAAVLIVGVLGAVGFYAVTVLFKPDKDENDHAKVDKDKEKEKEKEKPTDKEKAGGKVPEPDKEKEKVVQKEKMPEKETKKDGKDVPVPPKPKVVVPTGFEKAPDSVDVKIGEKLYASRIILKKGTAEASFRVMNPGVGKTLFYLMEDKVWNGLYRTFWEQEPDRAGRTWQDGGLAGGADRRVGDDDLRLPALRMTRDQAAACAAWMGGRLPRCEELDYAAGCADPGDRVGPARDRNVAVGRRDLGPRSIDDDTGDVSPLGIRDLSGNGWEWTTTELMAGGRRMAVLRGQRYTAQAPLSYKTLNEWKALDAAPTQYPDAASPYTGFRVVVDVK